MARIGENAFRQYRDGQDRLTAPEYMAERELIRLAVNDLDDKVERTESIREEFSNTVGEVEAVKEEIVQTKQDVEARIEDFTQTVEQTIEQTNQELQNKASKEEVSTQLNGKASKIEVQAVSTRLEEKDNLISTATWGLSLTSDNSKMINSKISALDSNKRYTLYLDNIYPVASTVKVENKNIHIQGNGGFRALTSGMTVLKLSGCKKSFIENVTINGSALAQIGIDIMDSEGSKMENVSVDNIGNTSLNNTVGILVSVRNDNSYFKKCKITNVIASSVSTGINVDNYRDSTSSSRFLDFESCYIDNVQPQQDADGIKILQSDVDSHIAIRDCKFFRCAKRGIKAQSRYVYTENNYIEDPQYAGIDFQRGYGKSLNDTVYSPIVGSDQAIAVSGHRNHIKGATLICTAPDQAMADGIYINNVNEQNIMESLTIEDVKMQGFRYPFVVGGVTNIDLLRINKCEIKGFYGTYCFSAVNPVLNINILHVHENYVVGSGPFYGFMHASYAINEYYLSNNRTPGNLLSQSYERKPGFIRDNTGQSFKEEKGVRYYWTNVIPSSTTNNLYENAKKGDVAINTNPAMIGAAGSRYVVKEWVCVADGDPVARTKGTWVEVRLPTGT